MAVGPNISHKVSSSCDYDHTFHRSCYSQLAPSTAVCLHSSPFIWGFIHSCLYSFIWEFLHCGSVLIGSVNHIGLLSLLDFIRLAFTLAFRLQFPPLAGFICVTFTVDLYYGLSSLVPLFDLGCLHSIYSLRLAYTIPYSFVRPNGMSEIRKLVTVEYCNFRLLIQAFYGHKYPCINVNIFNRKHFATETQCNSISAAAIMRWPRRGTWNTTDR